MGRNKVDGIIRTVDDLTDDLKSEIENLYIGERRTIKEVSEATKIKYPVISAHLRSRRLTRSFADYKSRSPWHQRQNESWAMTRAKRRLEDRQDAERTES